MILGGIFCLFLGGCSAERPAPPTLASEYPDLGSPDLALADEYLSAYENRENQPTRYQNARSRILSRMRQLRQSFEFAAGDREQQLEILATLTDLNQIMKETSVPTGYFLGQSLNVEPGSLQQCSDEGLAADIPEDVRLMLDVEFQGDPFSNYVARHVRQAFFVERLQDHVRILDSDRWTGTAEGATRSVIIDTYHEGRGENYEPWALAAALVHEAAHIDYFYRFASNPLHQDLDRVERFAYIVESAYLSSLFLSVRHDPCVATEIKDRIAFAFQRVSSRIERLNQRLGLAGDDLVLNR